MDNRNVVVCDNGTGVIFILLSLSLSHKLLIAHFKLNFSPYTAPFQFVYFVFFLFTWLDLFNIRLQYVKCGFAGENFPTSVFPCVVGRPMLRYEESLVEQELKVL